MNLCAVIVTHNRLELLKRSIAAVRGQTRPPDRILIVDNGSSDGTADWLRSQAGIDVLTQANLGSAGGQNAGIRDAFEKGADWFWCMDDDTLPDPAALEHLLLPALVDDPQTGFICSVARWTSGEPHRTNVPAIAPAGEWIGHVLQDRFIPARFCSFVSVLVSRKAVAEVGLPLRPYFMWWDDGEFTTRIGERFKGYLSLESTVLHATADNAGSMETPRSHDDPRLLYLYRNYAHMVWQRPRSLAWKGAALLRYYREGRRSLKGWRARLAAWRHMVAGIFSTFPIDYPN